MPNARYAHHARAGWMAMSREYSRCSSDRGRVRPITTAIVSPIRARAPMMRVPRDAVVVIGAASRSWTPGWDVSGEAPMTKVQSHWFAGQTRARSRVLQEGAEGGDT